MAAPDHRLPRAQGAAATSPVPPAQALLGARAVALAGGVLVLLALALGLTVVLMAREDRLADESLRSQLLARVLEDHATRSLETAALALAALGDTVAAGGAEGGVTLGPLLAQRAAGLPLLRSLAVLDARGQVLASSAAGEQGLQVPLQRLGPLPPPGGEVMGPFVPGRGLAAVAANATDGAGPPGVGFLPLVRQVVTAAGQARLVVALVNPDLIANHQQQLLDEQARAAVLAGFDGQALAASAGSPVLPGQRLQGLPVFERYLPGVEHGSYVGAGFGGADQVVAFRASRTRPVVVVVDTPVQQALLAWRQQARWTVGAAGVMALVIAVLTLTATRSLRAREAARLQRDQAQAEVALRERELSVIVKSVQELLFRTDAQGRLVFVNARWQAASGYPEAQALGHPLASLVRPESAAAAAALFALDGPGGVRSAQVLLGPAGDLRHYELSVAPLRAGGEIVGFAGSAMDVTARHTAQTLLRSQLAFTELLLDVMPLPLTILDTAGRYVSVNQAWEDFTGRRRDEVVGQVARDGLPAAEAQLQAERDAELLARGGRMRYDATRTHRDGSRRDMAITKAAVPGEDGRPAGILVAFMDVTEFRQAERATREARDAAEEASRSKTEFVANISHELRTPLQSIVGFSELGMMRSGEQARLGSMFGDIHAAGQRMLALVNDLLDVAKIESTVGTFHLERTDVRSLVRDVVGELQPLLSARQLGVAMALSEAPLVAKVDPTRFQQVVRNVLANAIRFSPRGETLAVAGDIGPDNRIHITVADRGPGIPPAELEKIFEAFVQSSKTKDGSGGTGLGLAICRKILEAHGGEIRAENNPGGGAIFHILLPARGFAETQPPQG